jgi:hypothetical protein
MRAMSKTFTLALLLACSFLMRSAAAAQSAPARVSIELQGVPGEGPDAAYQLTRTSMTEEQWKQYVDEVRRKYKTWESDTGGDMGRFLNDRLIIVALSAAGGDVDAVQRGMAYLALYKEFNQAPPSVVTKFLAEHRGSASRLLKDFTWEKAGEYVRNRRWREDIAERRNAAKPVEVAEIKPAPMSMAAAPAVVAPPAPAKEPEVAAKAPAAALPETSKSLDLAAVSPQTYSAQGVGRPISLSCLRLLALDWQTLTMPQATETPLTEE